jgi:ubiquinone/menaquinone biosynthesis C-methylase UbiE
MGWYSNIIFPWAMNWLMSKPAFSEQRVAVLKDVSGDILEIGFGTGLNLPHYPAYVSRLVTIEPNLGMARYATQQIATSPIEVEQHATSGEALPLADASFDTVVSTWTLCSIPDVELALREVRRVLKPGGRFLFLEHGLSPDANVARWQHRLNPVQQVLGDGCHLDRDMRELVADTGFSQLTCENFYFENTPKFVGYMYRGMAVR